MDEEEKIALEVANALEVDRFIKNIHIEKTNSPWNEKIFMKGKKDYIDVKLTVWKDSIFLYGRIYRLLLYIYDVLSPGFQYSPDITPDKDKYPEFKHRHNQIWSIYVDSRVEKRGIDNFFDKTVRKNIFVDSERELANKNAAVIFQTLWEKASFTYPEIADYTYNLYTPKEKGILNVPDIRTVEMDIFLSEPRIEKHIDKIPSEILRNMVNKLLNFAAYSCKDAHIESSYYGILLFYQKRVFLEIIPTSENFLFLTLLDTESDAYKTYIIAEDSNIIELQQLIKEMYDRISLHSHFHRH